MLVIISCLFMSVHRGPLHLIDYSKMSRASRLLAVARKNARCVARLDSDAALLASLHIVGYSMMLAALYRLS